MYLPLKPPIFNKVLNMYIDALFDNLYNELRYRHYSSRFSPVLSEKADAFSIYTALFNILWGTGNNEVQVPKEWTAAIVSSFLQHYLEFTSLRLASHHEEDASVLTHYKDSWSYDGVQGHLLTAVQRSGVTDNHLATTTSSARVCLGMCSLVALCAIATHICDYSTALRYLKHVGLLSRDPFSDLPVLKVTACYYGGFASM